MITDIITVILLIFTTSMIALCVWILFTIHRVTLQKDHHVPNGWKLVPVEPTDKMLQSASLILYSTPTPDVAVRNKQYYAYKALLDTAPKP